MRVSVFNGVTKKCNSCFELLDLSDFYKMPRKTEQGSGAYRSVCKACYKEAITNKRLERSTGAGYILWECPKCEIYNKQTKCRKCRTTKLTTYAVCELSV